MIAIFFILIGLFLEGKDLDPALTFSMAAFLFNYFFNTNVNAAYGFISLLSYFSILNRIGELLSLEENED